MFSVTDRIIKVPFSMVHSMRPQITQTCRWPARCLRPSKPYGRDELLLVRNYSFPKTPRVFPPTVTNKPSPISPMSPSRSALLKMAKPSRTPGYTSKKHSIPEGARAHLLISQNIVINIHPRQSPNPIRVYPCSSVVAQSQTPTHDHPLILKILSRIIAPPQHTVSSSGHQNPTVGERCVGPETIHAQTIPRPIPSTVNNQP